MEGLQFILDRQEKRNSGEKASEGREEPFPSCILIDIFSKERKRQAGCDSVDRDRKCVSDGGVW